MFYSLDKERYLDRYLIEILLIGCSNFGILRIYGISLSTNLSFNTVHSICVLTENFQKWNIKLGFMMELLDLI